LKRAFLPGLALALFGATAVAQPSSTDIAIAEALYREARELMDQKKYEEACRKFEESNRLDPATGTLLNLAACHESAGLVASAWREYGEALLAARRDQREDRVVYAEERIRALEPKLSRLAILVPAEVAVEGLEIRIDGALIRSAGWGVAAPVDPGEHVIEATAPGRKPWSTRISVGAEADSKQVQVPPLEAAPSPAPIQQPVVAKPAPVAPPPPPAADALAGERPIPAAVYVSGGATIVFAAVAGVSGAVYLSRRADYRSANEDPGSNPRAREVLRDDAQLPGLISTISTGAAVAGAIVTGYLYATRPSRPAAVGIAPWALPRAAGFSLRGNL
jgi:hypothetical protein